MAAAVLIISMLSVSNIIYDDVYYSDNAPSKGQCQNLH
jgi:hypothetical protein